MLPWNAACRRPGFFTLSACRDTIVLVVRLLALALNFLAMDWLVRLFWAEKSLVKNLSFQNGIEKGKRKQVLEPEAKPPPLHFPPSPPGSARWTSERNTASLGRVWNSVGKISNFGLKKTKGFRKFAAHSTDVLIQEASSLLIRYLDYARHHALAFRNVGRWTVMAACIQTRSKTVKLHVNI